MPPHAFRHTGIWLCCFFVSVFNNRNCSYRTSYLFNDFI